MMQNLSDKRIKKQQKTKPKQQQQKNQNKIILCCLTGKHLIVYRDALAIMFFIHVIVHLVSSIMLTFMSLHFSWHYMRMLVYMMIMRNL
jgi:hypothetical protein